MPIEALKACRLIDPHSRNGPPRMVATRQSPPKTVPKNSAVRPKRSDCERERVPSLLIDVATRERHAGR